MAVRSRDMLVLKQASSAMKERLVSLLAASPGASPAVKDALIDMLASLRSFERHADFILSELQRK